MAACKQLVCLLFFFSSRRRHTRFDCDWSSDVCSSDLQPSPVRQRPGRPAARGEGDRSGRRCETLHGAGGAVPRAHPYRRGGGGEGGGGGKGGTWGGAGDLKKKKQKIYTRVTGMKCQRT